MNVNRVIVVELRLKLVVGMIFLFLFNFCVANQEEDFCEDSQVSLKALHLKDGDLVSLIAPGSRISESQLRFSKNNMNGFDLEVEYSEDILGNYGYFSGTDEKRVAQINSAFKNTKIKAIFAVRGGYGTLLLLDDIDYEAIKNNPKIVMGYSDVTALLMAIYQKTGLITFHGPMTKFEWPSFTANNVRKILFAGNKITMVNKQGAEITTINGGKAKGVILGGNLSTLVSMIGSEYFPEDWRGKILFLEDIGEAPYRIDRMLAQLKHAGVLSSISGFIFGTCVSCGSAINGRYSFRVDDVVKRYIEPLEIPAFSGAMIGHQNEIFVVPVGGYVEMSADEGTITLLESVVK